MDLANAREAFEQSRTENSNASESAPNTQEQSNNPTLSEMLELDKLEKFKFGEREWTPKDLQAELEKDKQRQADYTRKTQEIAQERKYYDNLRADLASVRQNPSLAEEFKRIYPEKFHAYLDDFGLSNSEAQAAANNTPQGSEKPSLPPEFAQVLTRLEKIEGHFTEAETKALQREIDAAFAELGPKYPDADESLVLYKADMALKNGTPLRTEDGSLNREALESLFKQENDRMKAKFESRYKQQVEKQKQANAKGRDVASGGGVPGQAPEKVSLAEAGKKALAHFGH